MATVAELEVRVQRVEREMERLKTHTRPETRRIGRLELSDSEEVARLFGDLFRELGVDVNRAPVPMHEIHQRMIAHGVRPEENLVSSEIRRLRGEEDAA